MSMFLNYLSSLYNFLFIPTSLKVFFAWLNTKEGINADSILVNLPWHKYTCNRHRQPVKKVGSAVDFVICLPGQHLPSLASYSMSLNERWRIIFKSPNLEIWHRDSYARDKRPICLGLLPTEKEELLTEARNSLTHFVRNQTISPLETGDLSPRLLVPVDIDVALWMNGELRGSAIVYHTPLLEAVSKATILSAQDRRFKPISRDELPNVAIEMTIISDLHIPLAREEINKNEIYGDKAYLGKENGKIGCFVPAVFNCQRFYSLAHLSHVLFEQKLSTTKVPRYPHLFVAEVIDFIETKSEPLVVADLTGPILHKVKTNKEHPLSALAKLGHAYIAGIQEKDGNLPPIFNPLSGKTEQIDWVRLAHAGLALVTYGKKIGSVEIIETGRRALAYLQGYIYTHQTLPPQLRLLSLLYLNKAAQILGDEENGKKSASVITSLLSEVTYEPIIYAQIALFHLRQNTDQGLYEAVSLTRRIQTDLNFKIKNNLPVDLASYCDLIPLLTNLGNLQKYEDMVTESKNLAVWYSEKQLAHGAFPIHSQTSFCNTRGTTKIFEILINNEEFSTAQQEKLIYWLNDMQYTEENMFFVPTKNIALTKGGFRHDTQNHSILIDSISHLLLAASANK